MSEVTSRHAILTLPRAAFPDLPARGAWDWTGLPAVAPVWRPRAAAERDERFLQLIPYGLLCNGAGEIWCYARRGGDCRLRDRLSCGVGGHVERDDRAATLSRTLMATLRRELIEELGNEVAAVVDGAAPVAMIYEGVSAVGRVHLGVVVTLVWPHPVVPQPREAALESLGFRAPADILADPRFELWSRLAIEWLSRQHTGQP